MLRHYHRRTATELRGHSNFEKSTWPYRPSWKVTPCHDFNFQERHIAIPPCPDITYRDFGRSLGCKKCSPKMGMKTNKGAPQISKPASAPTPTAKLVSWTKAAINKPTNAVLSHGWFAIAVVTLTVCIASQKSVPNRFLVGVRRASDRRVW